jgi:hypothetical protein
MKLLLYLIVIIFILILILSFDNKEYYTVVDDITNTKISYFKNNLCNIYKNLGENNIDPRYLDTNLNRLDTGPQKTIQYVTQYRLGQLCKFDKYRDSRGPFYEFLNCIKGKECEQKLSNEDKTNICYMVNNQLNNCKSKCKYKTEECNPIDNTKCIKKEEYNKLNLLCNGINNLKEYRNSDNILFKHYYCKEHENEYNCEQMNALNLLNKLSIRSIDKEDCSLLNNGAGLYDTEETRDKFYYYDKINMNDTPCTVRPNVLARDSIDGINYELNIWGSTGTICNVGDGKWNIPTENRILTNERTIQIDHHVPLKNAYVSGACFWKNKNISKAYGNDMTPGHLKAISYTMNTSKSDKSPHEWTPYKYRKKHLNTPNAGEITEEDCKYASDWIAVKYRYDLSITQNEKDELEKVLNSSVCSLGNNMYPSYPIFENDPKGFSKIIAENDSNILLTPLLNLNDYKKRLKLKTKWLDLDRNTILPEDQIKHEAIIDLKNNKNLFGIYNDKYINKLNLKQAIKILLS